MDMQIDGIDVDKLINFLKSRPIMTEEEEKVGRG
jgi:hypothetical protein